VTSDGCLVLGLCLECATIAAADFTLAVSIGSKVEGERPVRQDKWGARQMPFGRGEVDVERTILPLSAAVRLNLHARFDPSSQQVTVQSYGIAPLCQPCALQLADPVVALHFPHHLLVPSGDAPLIKLSSIPVTREAVIALFPTRICAANGCSLASCVGSIGVPLVRYQVAYAAEEAAQSHFICSDCATRFRRSDRRDLPLHVRHFHTRCRKCSAPVSHSYTWHRGKELEQVLLLSGAPQNDIYCERCVVHAHPLSVLMSNVLYDALPDLPRVLADLLGKYLVV